MLASGPILFPNVETWTKAKYGKSEQRRISPSVSSSSSKNLGLFLQRELLPQLRIVLPEAQLACFPVEFRHFSGQVSTLSIDFFEFVIEDLAALFDLIIAYPFPC